MDVLMPREAWMPGAANAERKGMSIEEAERWLAPNLGYDT